MPKKKVIKKNKPKKKTEKKLSLMPKKNALTTDIQVLESAFEGDKKMVLFFLAWMKHNRNATKAYQEINPDVSYQVAAVMGSRLLKRVNMELVLDSYGIGIPDYFNQLKDGLNAMKQVEGMLIGADGIQKASVEIPDHKTRRVYHRALGEILKIEKNENNVVNVANQINNNNSIDNINDDELDDIIA